MVDNHVLELLKKRDQQALREVYTSNKEGFVAFAKKYSIANDDILDIYQDVIIALLENIALGKLETLNSSLKTYLFSIGKYMIYDYLRKKKKMKLVTSFKNEDFEGDFENEFDFLFNKELTGNQKKLYASFNKLGDKCKEVLSLFYYRGFTIDEISEHLNYNNKDVVKSQKSRCLKSLKAKIAAYE